MRYFVVVVVAGGGGSRNGDGRDESEMGGANDGRSFSGLLTVN